VGFGLLAVLVALDRAGLLAAPANDVRRYDGVTAHVLRVVDGDTLIVDVPDVRAGAPATRIRVWGIDTPELSGAGGGPEPYALEAARFVEGLAEGRAVTLEIEPHRPRGRYGRVLAHVRLESGQLLGTAVLRAGLGRADDRWPHRWMDHYRAAELAARRAGRGIWGGKE